MKPAAAHELIAVDDLRVGMFVHLDMSWMSHPFPVGSFKIANPEQVATIRSLGVQSVRWIPTQSDTLPPTEPTGWTRPATLDPATAPSRPVPLDEAAGAVSGTAAATAHTPQEAASAATAALRAATLRTDPPEAVMRHAHRQRLAAQRAALQLCERQFTEAAHDCAQLTGLADSKPVEARERAEKLSKALVDKMLGERDLCIRLLTDAAGDKAATHALNVTVISLLMGRTFGLTEPDMQDLGVGAMLHDIGKTHLPDRVRHREDHFSGAELRFYEEHVAHGVSQARKMGLSPGATLVIAQHHELADGSGFPLHLNTDRMTPAARIVALVNRYDNLCNPNVAARALTPHESLSLLFAQARSKFDTAILAAFIRMMGVYPAGSTVQLTDDRYAMVVGVNSSRPLKPRVLVHEPKVPRDEALIVDLESSGGLGIRRSIRPAQLPAPSLSYLAPRPRVAYFFEPIEVAQDAALAA
ncbi:MAG TPA: HD domain-containing phosphohydrolase [Burkholderiaceae bacterium]|nr:HD domain-containing phosphohydrolase [Burkholderiaceae bacterium]